MEGEGGGVEEEKKMKECGRGGGGRRKVDGEEKMGVEERVKEGEQEREE